MTPKVKVFENVFPDSSTGHRITFHDKITGYVKIGRCKVAERSRGLPQKNSRSAGLPSPHFA